MDRKSFAALQQLSVWNPYALWIFDLSFDGLAFKDEIQTLEVEKTSVQTVKLGYAHNPCEYCNNNAIVPITVNENFNALNFELHFAKSSMQQTKPPLLDDLQVQTIFLLRSEERFPICNVLKNSLTINFRPVDGVCECNNIHGQGFIKATEAKGLPEPNFLDESSTVTT